MQSFTELEYKYIADPDTTLDDVMSAFDGSDWMVRESRGRPSTWQIEDHVTFTDTADKQLLNNGSLLRFKSIVGAKINGEQKPVTGKWTKVKATFKKPSPNQYGDISSRETNWAVNFDRAEVDTLPKLTEHANTIARDNGIADTVYPVFEMSDVIDVFNVVKDNFCYSLSLSDAVGTTLCGRRSTKRKGLEIEQLGRIDPETGKADDHSIDPETSQGLMTEIHNILMQSGLDLQVTQKSKYELMHGLIQNSHEKT